MPSRRAFLFGPRYIGLNNFREPPDHHCAIFRSNRTIGEEKATGSLLAYCFKTEPS